MFYSLAIWELEWFDTLIVFMFNSLAIWEL